MIADMLALLGQTAAAARRSGPSPAAAEPGAWAGLVGALMGLVALAAAIWLARWIIARTAAARSQGPGTLFVSLCKAHGLGWSDRRLLRRLARGRGLADPNRLFVEPRHFETPPSSTPGLPAERLADLRQRLFGV